MTDAELLVARDKAWVEWGEYEHAEYDPRFYKHRIKGRLVLINPFSSIAERDATVQRRAELARVYYALEMEAYNRGLPRVDADRLPKWEVERTPDGERWRRTP